MLTIAFFTAEVRVRSQASSCEIRGGKSDTGTEFLLVLGFSSVSIFPLMLHTYLHLNTTVIRKVSGRRMVTFKLSDGQ